MVEKIFEIQKDLMSRLFAEHKLPYDSAQDIDHPAFQEFLKSLAWRVVEEFTEAATIGTDEDYIKELCDALHFLTELCIFSDVKPEFKKQVVIPNFWDITIELGLAMNELKNRPWTKTARVTNVNVYKDKISQSWSLLAAKMSYMTDSEQSILDHYIVCNNKNKDRIANGY